MPCLSGVAAAGSTALGYGFATTDGNNLWGNWFVNARDNMASQEFNRQLYSIDYKIQRQQLHREDIRDLVQLTASRMEIYHLVGTLMLTFVMIWYTDNTVASAPFEAWFTDLFLISNFSAVGFLLLCVWLAMYASLASRSIGTRLLTSYARLSFPSKDEITKIDVPLFFPDAREAMRKKFSPVVASAAKNFQRTKSDPSIRRERDISTSGTQDGGMKAAINVADNEAEAEDFEQHFRRFLEELPRWLVYDTWARACMSFGINQLLRALSYFSLGMLWAKSPVCAAVSIMAVRVLSIIIMRLDYGDIKASWKDNASVWCLNILPPMLAVTLIVCQASDLFLDLELNSIISAILVMTIFGAHAGWLWYLVDFLPSAPRPGAGDLHGRFHPGNFAHVLEWVQPVEETGQLTSADSSMSFGALQTQWQEQEARGRCVSVADGRRFFSDEVERDNTRLFGEELAESRSSMYEVNGGHTPGKWMIPETTSTEPFQGDLDHASSTDWLPVRMTRTFAYATMAWYLFSGVLHVTLTLTDGYSSYGSTESSYSMVSRRRNRTSSLLQLPLNTSLEGTILPMHWPEPAGFFEVNALHCSGSRLWISSKFSLYAVDSSVGTNTSGTFTVEHEGNVLATICGARRCHIIRRSTQGNGTYWSMDRMHPPLSQRMQQGTVLHLWRQLAATIRRHNHHTDYSSTHVPLPSNWQLLSGIWQDCPAGYSSCQALMFAGWDGDRIAISTLKNDDVSAEWLLHTRFEVYPSTGHCPPGRPGCTKNGPQSYREVLSLQLSENGLALIVLLPGGFVDIWDLSKAVLQERLELQSNFSSMCLNGRGLLLSRPGDDAPIVVSTPSIHSLESLYPIVRERRFGYPDVAQNLSRKRGRLRQMHLSSDLHSAVSMMQVASHIRTRRCIP